MWWSFNPLLFQELLSEKRDIHHHMAPDLAVRDVAVAHPAANGVVVFTHANPVCELAPRHHRRRVHKVFQRQGDSFHRSGLCCTMLVFVGKAELCVKFTPA